MDQYISQITRIIYTLNQVNVQGEENLDCLLGSILSLKKIRAEMEARMLEGKTNEAENK